MIQFPAADSQMARAIKAFDWSATPLGPIEGWPAALKIVVNLVLESSFPKALVWGPDFTTIHNDAFLPILGAKPPALGRSFAEVWAEAWDSIGPIARRAYAGESTFIENYPLVVNRNGFDEQAYFTFCYSPVRDDEGRVAGMMDTVIETTRAVEAHGTERLLRRELIHRVKNMMAVTSAVVGASLRHADTLEEARRGALERIEALARAQGLLAQPEDNAEMGQVVRDAIAPHVEDWSRVAIEGPEMRLTAQQAVGISLAIYELATNALKYGALSSEAGRIAIRWQADARHRFRFIWQETDGPPVAPPVRAGFGSRLTNSIVAAYFSGHGETRYDPAGVLFVLEGTTRAGAEAAEPDIAGAG